MANKLAVWPPQPAKPEKEVFVELTGVGRGEVLVRLVDAKGQPICSGSLVVITLDGYYPCHGVNPGAGIAVDRDKDGQMKELSGWPL